MKALKQLLLFITAIVFVFASQSHIASAFDESFAIGNGVLDYRPGEGCLSPTNSCSSLKLKVATYNILGKAHSPSDWKMRADKVIKNIQDNDVNVIGFQEMEPDQRDYIQSKLDYKRTTWGKSSDSILWNGSLFDQVDKGTWNTTYFKGQIQEPWVKLRDKTNTEGREFFVMNVHDPINRGKGSNETRLANVEAHINQIKKIIGQAPVILTGDFNQGYNKDQGAGASSNENTAYCKLTKDGFMNHVYDLWKNRKVKCPNETDPKDNMPHIDHIYVSPGISVSDIKVINTRARTGSDHDTFIASIELEGNCTGQPFNGEISVAQANLKYDNKFASAVKEITNSKPDFVSLNEVMNISQDAMTQNGYSAYKDESARGQERSTAVLWDSARWSKIDAGRELMVANGPQEWDAGRSFTWVVLQDNTGNTASMISLHHMINPRYYGPNMPLRQELYKQGLEKLINKVKELSTRGAVVVAGDFNSRYPDNDPWGPRKMLGSIDMKSTFDTMGPVQTHDGNGTIDYIFHTNTLKTLSQSAKPTDASDHRILYAKLQGTGLQAAPASTTTSNSSCVCKDPSIIDADGGVAATTENLKSFIEEYVGYAVKANEDYGIPYETNIAQGYLESGSGQSLLAKKYFNFHGLKAGSSWDGPVVDLETQEEYTPGNTTTITDGFRVFRNAEAGWRGYAEFIVENPRYEPALKYPGDPYKYLQAIKDAGYATDSEYVSKVSKIIDAVIQYVKEKNLAPPSSEIEVTGAGSSNAPDITSDCGEVAGSGSAADIVKIAKQELAKSVHEYDANVLKYSDNNRESWCADFVSWVYKQAGSPFTGGASGGWRIASVSTLQDWFKKNGHYFKVGDEEPQPGDVAFYIGKQTPDGGSQSHVNLVIEVNGNKMTTIGGNESDTVSQSTRTIVLDNEGLVGFGRMK